MSELKKALDNFDKQFTEDIISRFEHCIGFKEALLKQAIAFRDECVSKGKLTLIADSDKNIENLRENIASLNEQLIQLFESM